MCTNRPPSERPAEQLAHRVQVFHGRATSADALIYATCDVNSADIELAGTITGPVCAYAKTLEATIPLRPMPREKLAPGELAERPLANAVVPDPCYWTPEMPFLYRARVEVRQGTDVLTATEQTFGVRHLGIAGRNLRFDGRNWVLRGGRFQALQPKLSDCHEAGLALLVESPDEEFCTAADETGVLLLAELDATADLLAQIMRLSRHASVGAVVFPAGVVPPPGSDHAAPNVLFAQRFARRQPIEPAPETHLIIAEVAQAEEIADCPRNLTLPLLVLRPAAEQLAPEAARDACDKLQAQLAGRGRFAGYIV